MKSVVYAAAFGLMASLAPVSGFAQSVGIDFAAMPKGTTMFYTQNGREKWTEVYVGKRGKRFMTRVYSGHGTRGKLLSTVYWDQKGRRLYYTGGNRGYKYSFLPFDCAYQIGKCSHKERFVGEGYEGSGETQAWNARTSKTKGRYTTVWTRPKHEGKSAFLFTLGKYNLRTETQWLSSSGLQTVKLVKVK